MQSSSHIELSLSHCSVLHAASATTRAAGEHAGSSSHLFKAVQFIGSEPSDGTAHVSKSEASKSTSLLGRGCSVLLQFSHSSSSNGSLMISPVTSGDCCTSIGSDTSGPPGRSTIEPQSSISNGSSTSRIVVQSGSLVFKLTATFEMHDAVEPAAPQGHWYTWISNGRPSYVPDTSRNTPMPWKL